MTSFTWHAVTIDCVDPVAVAGFWAGLLDLERRDARPGWVRLGGRDDARPLLNFQPVAERKQSKNRLHLDMTVDDLGVAVRRVEELGGRFRERHVYPGAGVVVVMADPEQNEFCLTQYFDAPAEAGTAPDDE